jgi:hypothetical protein
MARRSERRSLEGMTRFPEGSGEAAASIARVTRFALIRSGEAGLASQVGGDTLAIEL